MPEKQLFTLADTLTICKLLNHKVVDANGKVLGRVADIQLSCDPPYRIIALLYGRRGWLHRLHVLNPFTFRHSHPLKPALVLWQAIECIEGQKIFLRPGEPHGDQPEAKD